MVDDGEQRRRKDLSPRNFLVRWVALGDVQRQLIVAPLREVKDQRSNEACQQQYNDDGDEGSLSAFPIRLKAHSAWLA
jgi:hypothetical protein